MNGPSGPRGIDTQDVTGWSEEPSSTLSDSIDENCWHTEQLDRAAPVVSAVSPALYAEITQASVIRRPYVVYHISRVHSGLDFLARSTSTTGNLATLHSFATSVAARSATIEKTSFEA